MVRILEHFEAKDNVSLPRQAMFLTYLEHCQQHGISGVNSASFGKVCLNVGICWYLSTTIPHFTAHVPRMCRGMLQLETSCLIEWDACEIMSLLPIFPVGYAQLHCTICFLISYLYCTATEAVSLFSLLMFNGAQVVRQVFPNVKTRRLGTRGQSR